MNPPVAALRGEQKRLALACARLDWSDVDKASPSIVGAGRVAGATAGGDLPPKVVQSQCEGRRRLSEAGMAFPGGKVFPAQASNTRGSPDSWSEPL